MINVIFQEKGGKFEMPSEIQDRGLIIAQTAGKILYELERILPSNPSEAEFRERIDPILEEFCTGIGSVPVTRFEYTLATGRADAVFSRFVIEYERPGVLKKNLSSTGTRHAVQQVKNYIEGLAKKERHKLERLAGVAFDGYLLVFIRYTNGHWVVEEPVEVNKCSLERFLTWLAGLSSGIALTADNLNIDFSIKQLRTQKILRELFSALNRSLDNGDPIVSKLFEQWQMFFSEAIDYSEAFGDRKLETLKEEVRKACIEIQNAKEAERFFFVLHTYFALLVKLLAWLALSRHLAVKLGAPSFSKLLSADDETLRRSLKEMESGGIFRAYGILNLLEGDFFEWYLHAWTPEVSDAIREIIRRLDEYDHTTLTLVPEETRDLFKKLYHYLLPKAIRHNLGEYYTPDWLAQRLLNQVDYKFFMGDPERNEMFLRKKLLNTRFLDPACGSGTFLILIIARMIELGRKLMIPESELLEAILKNVVGFDLNPLAVITARVNYLLAIMDLLEHRQGDVTIPVYLADSVRTPAVGENLFSHDAYMFPTAIGTFRVPAAICTSGHFNRFCDLIEESLHSDLETDAFIRRCQSEIPLGDHGWDDGTISLVRELYHQMLDLHRRGMNGLWARLLKNNFAPLTVGEFDYVVGNPPWVNWEHLPDEYRDSIKPLWIRYGLFPHGGIDTILGKGKKDISMLMTYAVMDKLLRNGGKLGFVITQSVLKTSAGQGFRRFLIPRQNNDEKPIPISVVHVDDMVDLNPFEGASNRTAVMILEKGRPTKYPVSYTVWKKKKGASFTYNSTLKEVVSATKRLNFYAEPVDPDDPASPWLTARRLALKSVRKILGKSDYEAHAGAYTGGANSVYWMEIVLKRPDGLVVVRNITEGAKVKVDEVTETIEPDLLYPLLRGRDVKRWKAEPSAMILMVQDPVKRRGIDEQELQERYPRTYGYLKQFEDVLRKRSVYERYFKRSGQDGGEVETGPFYSMFDVGDYTFAPWKVVWTRVAKIEAAVVETAGGKPIIPQETITLVSCSSPEEAHYIAALVNSSPFQFAAISYSQKGGKSMGSMHVLEYIHVPKYNPSEPSHQKLAKLSKEAHEAVKAGDENRLRQIESKIDRVAAQLWGITDEELREIQQSLRELEGEKSEESTEAEE
ncbi:MAG: Eco57I restriction-modification methylase domain-containing protein [Thermotoga caldifontis]|uniref:Eco57I restriction-modification methylase domain-containing protein n=1 Tax=Thermotoga caldifontis TaxID=1508419 RepID=UPI003C7DCBFD